ncbi:PRA1 family protein 3 [Phlebotomus argentipes]|uniref:PRA1 family protein 3 n=1 Tax=Phlebotomus argentipes TaxID=94469 RepID=UPI0028937147|nr:PRA1 family protein 3 [Phlebotomus argentipes]
MSEFNFAPLRDLNDFLLSSASFGLPSVNDLEKWGNRVVKNLLYYQTNYFCSAAVLWLLLLLLNPRDFLQAALVAVGTAGGAKIVAMRHGDALGGAQRILAGAALVAVLILFLLELILFVMLTALLPFSVIFVHASLRLRNTKSKAVNTFGAAQLKRTPMGIFLGAMNLVPDNVWFN